jgi:hypothetical protein
MIFHCRSKKQVPPLRIAIDKTNRNAPVGMTTFGEGDRSAPLGTAGLGCLSSIIA